MRVPPNVGPDERPADAAAVWMHSFGSHESSIASFAWTFRSRRSSCAETANHATIRYTWKHSAYSRFTLIPCTRARFQT